MKLDYDLYKNVDGTYTSPINGKIYKSLTAIRSHFAAQNNIENLRNNADIARLKTTFRKFSCIACTKELPIGVYERHKSACSFKHIKFCKLCNNQIILNTQHDKKKQFCNSNCSAKYNNEKILRDKNPERNKGISINEVILQRDSIQKEYTSIFRKVSFHLCKICNKAFYIRGWHLKWHKSTCSKECSIHASVGQKTYQNGKKKLFKYFNKHQDKEITLESSWELQIAEFLDALGIKWIRTSYIKWFDGIKQRLYYPDFYLSDYNFYIDPKNPYCMKKDKKKMEVISQNYSILFGDVNRIIIYLALLKSI